MTDRGAEDGPEQRVYTKSNTVVI